MAGIIKRGGTYYAVYRAGGREKRRSLDTSSHRVAKAKLRDLEIALEHGGEDNLPTQTPLPDIVEAYVEHMQGLKTQASWKADLAYLRNLFGPITPALEMNEQQMKSRRKLNAGRQPVIQARYLEDISTAMISEFLGDIRKRRNLSAKTLNRYREVLMRLINWSVSQRGVRMPRGANPAKAVDPRPMRSPEIKFLSLDEIEMQLSALAEHNQLRTMVALYIYAGLRREEALWLTHDDVDLNAGPNGMIRVRAKTIDGRFWEPKTKRNRSVPISRTLRRYLDAYTLPASKTSWYFPSPEGGHWSPDAFSHALKRVNRKAKFTWGCGIYRHTFGSHLAAKGESLYKISELMGNSPEICRRHYAALLPESMIDSVEFGTHSNDAPTPPTLGLRLIAANGQLLDEKDRTG